MANGLAMEFKGPHELYAFLLGKVADGGTAAMEALALLARDERELLIKGPTIGALICWGEAGLSAISALALANPSSKNISQAYKALSVAASGAQLEPGLLFIADSHLTDRINAKLATGDLREEARANLTELLFSLDTADLLIPIGTAFTQLAGRHADLAEELISALSARWLRVGPTALQQYEALIQGQPFVVVAFLVFFFWFSLFFVLLSIKVW